jgi:hypothetical protein
MIKEPFLLIALDIAVFVDGRPCGTPTIARAMVFNTDAVADKFFGEQAKQPVVKNAIVSAYGQVILQKAIEDAIPRDNHASLFNDNDSNSTGALINRIAALPRLETSRYRPDAYTNEVCVEKVKQSKSSRFAAFIFVGCKSIAASNKNGW